MWILEIINLLLNNSLNEFALIPRVPEKLYAIVTMHFLHGNLPHIISNTLPLLGLGLLVSSLGQVRKVTFSIMILSGLMVWLFARMGLHLGASALVMGYWGYLVNCAIFEHSLKNMFVAVITLIVYGGIILTLTDFRESISFEGHIFGFMSGIICAWFWHKKYKKTGIKKQNTTFIK